MTFEILWINIITAFLSSGVIHWYFKERIKSNLKKDAEKEISKFNHDLSQKGEILKNELQREALKAELMWNNIHSIYPELTTNVEIAHGAIASLQGLTYSPDYNEYNLEDFKILLERKNLTKGKQEELNEQLRTDRENGISKMTKYLQMIETQEARNKLIHANNYKISKSIYCSDEVLTAFEEIYDALSSSLVDLAIGSEYSDMEMFKKGRNTITNDVPEKMKNFRTVIRNEIRNSKI